MIKTSVLAAFLGTAGAQQGSPVHVDMDKLTDFTAKFSVDTSTLVKNLQLPPDAAMMLPGVSLHGEVQADVGGERLKITLHGKGSVPDHNPQALESPPEWMSGARETGRAEFIFDGPGGFVSYRGNAVDEMPHSFPGAIKSDFCVHVNFPKGLLPPGQMIKDQVVQMKPMIEQQLSMMPHADATVDGDQVAIYNSKEVSHEDGPPMYVGIKEEDGTPLGAGVVQPSGGTWTPFFRFTQWTHGAGDISEIQCTDLDSSSLAADRYAAVHMQVFDRVMASLKGAEASHPVFAAFPAKPSLIFKTSGNAATALEEKPGASSSLFPTVAVAVAAGAFGGLVSFFAFLKGASKSTRVSLISDDA